MNKSGNGSRLVLFDFDGTLTTRDSFGAFLWFAVPLPALLIGCFQLLFRLPVLFYQEKKASIAGRAKAMILEIFLGGKRRAELRDLGESFYRHRLSRMLRLPVLELLREYRDAGDTVAVVSASIDIWLRPFCESERIQLICTELAYDNEVFKGHFSGENCNRAEKAWRIRAFFDLNAYENIIAYGNSSGDAAMVNLASEAWWVNPDGTVKNWPGKV